MLTIILTISGAAAASAMVTLLLRGRQQFLETKTNSGIIGSHNWQLHGSHNQVHVQKAPDLTAILKENELLRKENTHLKKQNRHLVKQNTLVLNQLKVKSTLLQSCLTQQQERHSLPFFSAPIKP